MAITSTNNLRRGSKGEDVSALQTALNQYGYGLAVDGSFGPATQAAVRDYQSKNGLTVDGVVGTHTWSSLTGGSGSATNQAAPAPTQTPLQALEGNRPTYTPAAPAPTYAANPTYQQQIATLTEKVLGRQPFQYDLNADMLYSQYKDQYTTLGKRAAADTQAQAAQLSGGYGNSYGVTAANQQYQNYLNRLNDMVPQLEQRAYERWLNEGQGYERQLDLLRDMENQDYGRYRDTLGDWRDARDFDYNYYQDALAGYRADRDYEYQREQDALDRALQEAALAARSSGGSGSSRSSSPKSPAGPTSNLLTADQAASKYGSYFEKFKKAGDADGLDMYLDSLIGAGLIDTLTAAALKKQFGPVITNTAYVDRTSKPSARRTNTVK